MTNKNIPVGIIGGGISGLSIAYALQEKGISATIYEQAETVGGSIQSLQKQEWLLEEGPNTLMVKSPAVWRLLENLGLDDDLLEANPAASKRYVVKNDTPVALPASAGSFLGTSLFSAGAKLRLLKEPFIPPSARHDESVASFISRRLGRQPLEYAVNPFVSGIYAGDPRKLSIKHTFSSLWEMEQQHGSLLKGMIKRKGPEIPVRRALVSFRGGNQALPKAMADALEEPVRTSHRVTTARRQQGGWKVVGQSKRDSFEATHRCLVTAVPTRAAASIFLSDKFDELANLPYAPISMLALGFAKNQVGHDLDGFGMLIPETEGFETLGVLFSSTLFPGRAPEGFHLLTCFIGGARNPALAGRPAEELSSRVRDELQALLDITGSPVFRHHRYWPQAIPQYEVGYDYYLSLMKEIEQENRGLYLDGNYRNGVSVPDCISSGFETAQKVHSFLRSKSGSY